MALTISAPDHDDDPDHGGHGHSHHGHGHASAGYGKAFLIGIVLNTGFVVAEVIYGLAANSLALLADAGHNAGDVAGLLMSWGAIALAKRKPDERFTYGLRGSSILAALANAILLLVACGGISWEAILRLSHPQPVVGPLVVAVAAAGIAVNGVTALLFASGRKTDLNLRGAFLHMASDALVALGVVIAALIIMATGWAWLDPAVSLAVSAVIVYGTWSLLRESFELALHATPRHVDMTRLKTYLSALPCVEAVHDLHVWAMSTEETALSVHLLMPGAHPGDHFLKNVAHALDHDFGIGHSTIQIELGGAGECERAPDDVV